jgi:hypothetical protein
VKQKTWWVFAGGLVVALVSSSYSQTAEGDILFSYVKGIEGRSPEGRKQFIKDKLNEFGIKFRTMPFDTILKYEGKIYPIRGENIIASFGAGKEKIVVGAHFDAVPGSPGANDNGSGVAVLLELVRNLKDQPLAHTIDLCFFDEEEDGLFGSYFYVRADNHTIYHLAMLNLDIEGMGNEIYVGPVGGGDDDLVMKYVRLAAKQTGFPVQESEYYPGSDFESFANAKLENISISVVPKEDVEKLSNWVKSGYEKIEYEKDVPEVLKVMHSPYDKSDFVSEKALNMSYEFTKTVLLLIDEGEKFNR